MDTCYCYICFHITEPEFLCDSCDRYYCEECSYVTLAIQASSTGKLPFTIHYQFQGARCYSCADQRRIKPLNKIELRDNKINFSIDKNAIIEPHEPQ